MAYFEDGSPCSYFGEAAGALLLAVGWIEPGHAFKTGACERPFVKRLAELLMKPWQPMLHSGVHRCGFCAHSGGPSTVTIDGVTASVGVNNLFIPDEERVWVAPSLVLHTIDAHAYVPPREFIRAVVACPDMRSMEYLRRMTRVREAITR